MLLTITAAVATIVEIILEITVAVAAIQAMAVAVTIVVNYKNHVLYLKSF